MYTYVYVNCVYPAIEYVFAFAPHNCSRAHVFGIWFAVKEDAKRA